MSTQPNVCRLTPALKRYVQHQWRVIDVLFAKINTATSDELHELQTAKTKLEYVMATGTVQESDKDQLKPVITLTNAPNIFKEAWKVGGVPAEQNPDTFAERKIDLEQLFDRSLAAYTQANLSDWIADIERFKRRVDFYESLFALKNNPSLQTYLKNGYEIIGIMPGKEAQLKQYQKALTELRPLCLRNRQKITIERGKIDPSLINDFLLDLTQQTNLTLNVPDTPYLLLAKLTQQPPAETRNKRTAEQLKLFQSLTQQPLPPNPPNPNADPNLQLMVLTEYVVTQTLSTQLTIENPYIASKGIQLRESMPLDRSTATHFIHFKPINKNIPCAYFEDGQLQFKTNTTTIPSEGGGFRLTLRFPI